MTKSMLFFIAVLIVALGARPGRAGDEREYVASTTQQQLPIVGIIEMHKRCKTEFPGTHFCSSFDINRNGGSGALPAVNAWIQPDLRTNKGGLVMDASGITSGGSLGEAGGLSCSGWRTISPNSQGLVLNSQGMIEAVPCNFAPPIPRVACCAEVEKAPKFNLIFVPDLPDR